MVLVVLSSVPTLVVFVIGSVVAVPAIGGFEGYVSFCGFAQAVSVGARSTPMVWLFCCVGACGLVFEVARAALRAVVVFEKPAGG